MEYILLDIIVHDVFCLLHGDYIKWNYCCRELWIIIIIIEMLFNILSSFRNTSILLITRVVLL